jgi:hypothetical protein
MVVALLSCVCSHRRAAFALLALLVLVSAPVAGARQSAAPVSWGYIEQQVDRPQGSYTSILRVDLRGRGGALERAWTAFDLRKSLIDVRQTTFDAAKSTFAGDPRSHPLSRFVYSADGILMWDPTAIKRCKTPWLELTTEGRQKFPGVFDPRKLMVNRPAQVLGSRIGAPKRVRNDARSTVYAVVVKGVVPVEGKSQVFGASVGTDPGPMRMEVEYPHGAGPIVFKVDVTKVIGKAMPSLAPTVAAYPDAVWTVIWKLDRTAIPPQSAHPAKVTPSTCLH